MGRDHSLIDLVGQRFGRLTVLARSGADASRAAVWLCRCDCGTEKPILGKSLRRSDTVSCGCQGRESRMAARFRHGGATREARMPEYMVWVAMKARCENRSDPNYHHYGGRGITLCLRWQDFAVFIKDMGRRPSRGATVERRDNGKGYSPENCYWASMTQQARNKRTNVPVMRGDGKEYRTIVEAAEDVGVHPTGISAACRGVQRTAGGHTWRYAALLTALKGHSPHD